MSTEIMGSVVLRNLRTSPFFKRGADTKTAATVALGESESIVGVYTNPVPWEHYRIVFTSNGFHLIDGDWVQAVKWEDIIDYEDPRKDGLLGGVRLETRQGLIFVRMAGRFGSNGSLVGNLLDTFSMWQILRALLGTEKGKENLCDP
jgi:hypothetical protein